MCISHFLQVVFDCRLTEGSVFISIRVENQLANFWNLPESCNPSQRASSMASRFVKATVLLLGDAV